MENHNAKLIFVYNAEGGVFNQLADAAHKIFSPSTYACNLCAITHGNFGVNKEWRAFLETLPVEPEFLHADEFKRKYLPENAELPAIFERKNGGVVLLVDADTINKCRSVEDLKTHLKR